MEITGSGATGMRSPLPHGNGREAFPRADIGDIISVIRDGEEYFFHYNHRGDVTALTDEEGTIVQRIAYDAFGTTTFFSGTLDNPYRFSTKELEPDAALYYFAFRHYDPQTGRFISQDPIRYVGLNQYTNTNTNTNILASVNPRGRGAQLSTWGAFHRQNLPPLQNTAPNSRQRIPSNWREFNWTFNGWPRPPSPNHPLIQFRMRPICIIMLKTIL